METYQLSYEVETGQGPVRSLSLGLLDNEILSGGQDAMVKRWQGPEEIGVLSDHDHWVTSLCTLSAEECRNAAAAGQMTDIHANGIIVSGSQDQLIRVFGPDGTKLQTLVGHTHGVISLSFTDDGYLISGSWDGTARVWDLSSGSCVVTLEGHENGVNVKALPQGLVATVSTGRQVNNTVQDFKLRIWNWKEQRIVHEVADHDGAIRSVDASDAGIVTCSNDGTVHLRTFDGQTIDAYSHPVQADGQPPYLLQTRFHPVTGEIISVGEDGTVCVWRDGTMAQNIQHPVGVWCVLPLPNGDFATGGHDGFIRVWTRDPQRVASEDQRVAFEVHVREEVEKRNKGPSDAEIAKLPLWENRGTIVGKSEGFVQLFNKGGKAIAAQWSAVSGTWIEVGEVTGMLDSGTIDGVRYDHVYDVEIETSMGLQKLQLGYNNGENPFVAAQRFIDANMLDQGYLAEIADYITQRSKTGQPMLDMTGGSTSAQPMDIAHQSQHLPAIEYIFFGDVGDVDKIVQKLLEFNAQCDASVQLRDAEVTAIQSLAATLKNKSYWHSSRIAANEVFAILRVIRTWPGDKVFPALDLLRLVLFHPSGPSAIMDNKAAGEMFESCANALNQPSTAVGPVMLALRCCCNAFKGKLLAQAAARHLPTLIDRAAAHVGAANKNIRAAVTVLTHNVAAAARKGVFRAEDFGEQCLSLLAEVLQREQAPDILTNAAAAAVTFAGESPQLKQTARDLDIAETASGRMQQAGTPDLQTWLEELRRVVA